MKGLIFNIQRFSVHDGDGIRTIVFFKGCPLKCPWCSNPESQSGKIETVKINTKCIHCKDCSFNVDECPSGAIKQFGKYMTVDEVVDEITKDSVFYSTSGGGVTLSGGEVLMQADFAIELLKKLKSLGIHTAIETSGYEPLEKIVELSKYLDLWLYDLKIMDPEKSKQILGADANIIKNNLKTLCSMGRHVIPRVPLIPGYTMNEDNIKEIISFVKQLGLSEIHLLPFHQYGSNKYEYLGKKYLLKDIPLSQNAEIEKIKEMMTENGLNAKLGGM